MNRIAMCFKENGSIVNISSFFSFSYQTPHTQFASFSCLPPWHPGDFNSIHPESESHSVVFDSVILWTI